ncbi:MAG: phosphatidylserine decarboxylase [Nitrospinota bacterium]|jgi:phosphatidylserine decarboxylase|nr:phosphatidylserine decarboxylase [Nitrospinota bacterium]HJM42528.1 phosphatidylserine decarboxylase [Nitrospinota bacterium]
MRLALAKDAFPYVGAGAILTGVSALAGWPSTAWSLGLLTAFVAFFFRDPDRVLPREPDAVLAPADGRVVDVRTEEDGGTRISIFLSVFNVHINRSPVLGRVAATEYRAGRFLAAFRREASAENEQNMIRILPEDPSGGQRGEVTVRQIAGAIARRIVCWTNAGDALRAGERLGLIKFGSRVDLHLPPGARPTVSVGDRVHGGSDIVARWEKAGEP